jgi:amidase
MFGSRVILRTGVNGSLTSRLHVACVAHVETLSFEAVVFRLIITAALFGICVCGSAPVHAQRDATPAAPYDVYERSISELQQAMQNGDVSAIGLVDAYLARIAAYDRGGAELNAIIRLNPRARDEAAALDAERRLRGPRGPRHGIPIIL